MNRWYRSLLFMMSACVLVAIYCCVAYIAFVRPAYSQSAAPAVAPNINITPRRVIFQPNKRSDVVYVFNQGVTSITLDVTLRDNVMVRSGEIVPVAEARLRGGEALAAADKLRSAKDYLIISPSRITVPAGGSRPVRLLVRVPDVAGEWRTHLTVATVPPPQSGLTAEDAAAGIAGGELSFSVQMAFGLSIPIILRSGVQGADARFGEISIDETKQIGDPNGLPKIVIPIRRLGALASLYGDIEVRRGSRKGELIAATRGVGVYPEIDERRVAVPLLQTPKAGETLFVTYRADADGASRELANGTIVAR